MKKGTTATKPCVWSVDELALHVFGYVPPLDLCRSVRLVCRHFHALSHEDALWRRLCLAGLLPPPFGFDEDEKEEEEGKEAAEEEEEEEGGGRDETKEWLAKWLALQREHPSLLLQRPFCSFSSASSSPLSWHVIWRQLFWLAPRVNRVCKRLGPPYASSSSFHSFLTALLTPNYLYLLLAIKHCTPKNLDRLATSLVILLEATQRGAAIDGMERTGMMRLLCSLLSSVFRSFSATLPSSGENVPMNIAAFQSTSLLSKLVTRYFQFVSSRYISQVIGKALRNILFKKKKKATAKRKKEMKESEERRGAMGEEKRANELMDDCQYLLDCIYESAEACPFDPHCVFVQIHAPSCH
ncbi:hypothetical protein QOT17_020017 [Balamuthia mandrillaris]